MTAFETAEDFLFACRDWQFDNNEEMCDLIIADDAHLDDETGCWIVSAEDADSIYSLTDDGEGNIHINYEGTK